MSAPATTTSQPPANTLQVPEPTRGSQLRALSNSSQFHYHTPAPHHSKYYLSEGDTCFLVQDPEPVLFRVHKQLFTTKSEAFDALLRIPASEEQGVVDGTSDTRPVILSTPFNTLRFELLVAWLYHEKLVPESTQEALELLMLSDFLIMPALRDHMANFLLSRDPPDLTPAHRINIIRHHQLGSPPFTLWMAQGFQALLERTSAALSPSDLFFLGPETTARLLPPLQELDRRRILRSTRPPAIHSPECKGNSVARSACEKAWTEYWKQDITPRLTDATRPWTPAETARHLKQVYRPWLMGSYGCMTATVDAVTKPDSLLFSDTEFIIRTSEQLTETEGFNMPM